MPRTASTPLYLGNELRAQAEAAAHQAGVSLSAWVREAIGVHLERSRLLADGLAAMAEWDAAEGPADPQVVADVERERGALDVARPRPA